MMNRRAFFGVAVAAIPAGAAISASERQVGGLRVSCVKGDPGERLLAMAHGDAKTITVYLDGVEQDFFITADEAEGFVVRNVETPDGGLAYNRVTGEWYEETVFGSVKIVIDDRAVPPRTMRKAAQEDWLTVALGSKWG